MGRRRTKILHDQREAPTKANSFRQPPQRRNRKRKKKIVYSNCVCVCETVY